jgi:hypothetical protein
METYRHLETISGKELLTMSFVVQMGRIENLRQNNSQKAISQSRSDKIRQSLLSIQTETLWQFSAMIPKFYIRKNKTFLKSELLTQSLVKKLLSEWLFLTIRKSTLSAMDRHLHIWVLRTFSKDQWMVFSMKSGITSSVPICTMKNMSTNIRFIKIKSE